MISRVVVLPAPFGTENSEDLAGAYCEAHVFYGENVSVELGKSFHLDNGIGHRRCSPFIAYTPPIKLYDQRDPTSVSRAGLRLRTSGSEHVSA